MRFGFEPAPDEVSPAGSGSGSGNSDSTVDRRNINNFRMDGSSGNRALNQ